MHLHLDPSLRIPRANSILDLLDGHLTISAGNVIGRFPQDICSSECTDEASKLYLYVFKIVLETLKGDASFGQWGAPIAQNLHLRLDLFTADQLNSVVIHVSGPSNENPLFKLVQVCNYTENGDQGRR